MGLYLKARSYLDQVGSLSHFNEQSKSNFLKGVSLLKKISNNEGSLTREEEQPLSESIIIHEEGSEELESTLDSIPNTEVATPLEEDRNLTDIDTSFLKFPEEFDIQSAVVIQEDDDIELDINIDFYPEYSEIEDENPPLENHDDNVVQNEEYEDEISPADTIELGSDTEQIDENIQEWEKDLSEEDKINEAEVLEKEDDLESDSEKKLDYYLVLNEITNELVQSSTFNDFYDNLLYSLEGQLGSNYIIIVSSLDERFEEYEIISYDGIELTENINISIENESIQKIIKNGNILESLSLNYKELNEDERKIFMLSPNEIIAPIISQENLIGFVVIGESNSGEKYQTFDIEFITLLMNVSSNILMKMYNQEKIQKELNEVNYKKEKIELLNSFSSEILKFKNYRDLIDSFIDILRKFEINEKVSVYAIDSSNNYKLIYNNEVEISETNIILVDDILIKQLKTKLMYQLINDSNEIARLKFGSGSKIVFPLIEEDQLIGLLVTSSKINNENEIFQALLKIVTGQLSRIIVEERLLEYSFNPLSKVEEMLKHELISAREKNESFTLYVIKIQNVGRIINILGNDYFDQYATFIKNTINSCILKSDTLSRVGQSKFSIFLRDKTVEEFEEFQIAIKTKLNDFQNPPRDFKISIQIFTLRFPDQSVDLRKYIELIEET
jgi:GGDEF domain-containing protein